MAVKLVDNFSFNGKKPLDARLVYNTVADLVAVNQNTIYDGICAYVVATQKFYVFNSTNTVDATLDKWRELTTAGILIQSATIDNVTTSATKGHLILTMSDGTTIDCGDAKGDKGDKGDGFAIIKLYTSVSDMTSDASPVNDGQMVAIIDSSTKPLTAKVYIRNSSQTQDASGNENGYTFFCNLADATVIQGPQGLQGPQGVKGDTPVVTTQTIAATSSTPSGTKITFTTGTGSTAVSTSINVYNGKDGVSVSSATINASGELVFTLSDASTINVGKIGGTGTGGCITMLGCFDTAPTTFIQNDIYYNNLDGLIYKSTNGTTWGTGSQPEKDILYISMDDHKIYSYTNNTFEVYGGSDTKISKEPFNTLSEKPDGLYAEPKGLGAAYRKETVLYTGSIKSTGNYTINDDIINYDALEFTIQWYQDSNPNTTQQTFKVKDILGKTVNAFMLALPVSNADISYIGGNFASATNVLSVNSVRVSSTDRQSKWKGITKIIGVKYTTDVSQLVDSSKSIEDTPVGELITKIEATTPAHYLLCDGSVYNIADYPHLAQYFKDTFGAINVFGGDGTTTFAVPKYISSDWWSPKMTSNNSPSPYVATASSDNSGNNPPYRAFNDNTSQRIGWHINFLTPQTPEWLQIDLGVSTKISKLKMYPRADVPTQIPKTIELQGSNDGTTFTSIKTFTTTRPTNTNPIELDIGKVVNYRFYKFVMPDYSFQRDDSPGIGNWGMSITQIYFYKYEGDFAFIKYEPTYYMELNQAAYINQYCDTYSTDEKIVGKWVNGKPIYRKIWTNITVSNGTQLGTIANVETVVDSDTVVTGENQGDGYWNNNYGVSCSINPTTGIVSVNVSGWTTINATCKLEYTKTTDAVNSFDYGMIMDQFAQEALLDVAVTDAEVDKCFE